MTHAIDIQALFIWCTEIWRSLDGQVEVERPASRVMVCSNQLEERNVLITGLTSLQYEPGVESAGRHELARTMSSGAHPLAKTPP